MLLQISLVYICQLNFFHFQRRQIIQLQEQIKKVRRQWKHMIEVFFHILINHHSKILKHIKLLFQTLPLRVTMRGQMSKFEYSDVLLHFLWLNCPKLKWSYFTAGKNRTCKSATFGTKVAERTTGSMLYITLCVDRLKFPVSDVSCDFYPCLLYRFIFKLLVFLFRKNLICKQHWCSYKRNLKRKIVSLTKRSINNRQLT